MGLDVAQDQCENYLGTHSWRRSVDGSGKDLTWYAKGKSDSSSQALIEEEKRRARESGGHDAQAPSLPPLNRPAESSEACGSTTTRRRSCSNPQSPLVAVIQRSSTPCSWRGRDRIGGLGSFSAARHDGDSATRGGASTAAPQDRLRAVVVRPMASGTWVAARATTGAANVADAPRSDDAVRAPVARPMVTPRARELRSAHRTASTATATVTTITTTGVTSMKSTTEEEA